MELETACRHGAPITVVICNDQAWGMVKHHQELCYEECRVCGTELGVIHYEKIAEALGGHGEFVDKDEDILPALKRALESRRARLRQRHHRPHGDQPGHRDVRGGLQVLSA